MAAWWEVLLFDPVAVDDLAKMVGMAFAWVGRPVVVEDKVLAYGPKEPHHLQKAVEDLEH